MNPEASWFIPPSHEQTANVVVTPDGRANVLDFDLARRIPTEFAATASRSSDAQTVQGVAGTPSNHPFDISPDGKMLATTNAVHISDEIWLLEPARRR